MKPDESQLKRLDKKPISLKSEEIFLFSCVRNEILRLPYFIEYHRNLGIDRFFFIDNNSGDGTREYLLSQPDVHLYHSEGSYARSRCGLDWLHELLNRYAPGHWALTLDADELLVFPDCEQLRLRQLTQYLEGQNAEALATFLLDIYSDKPIEQTTYLSGQPFIEACPYFDVESYQKRDNYGVPLEGGPRLRLFSKPGGHTPHIRKVPLVRWRTGIFYESGTHIIENVSLNGLTGALLHFKFFSKFPEHVQLEVARNEHWNDAAEYRQYAERLAEHPKMILLYDGSKKYENSRQLVELGLMKMPETFWSFSASHQSKTPRVFALSALVSRLKKLIAN